MFKDLHISSFNTQIGLLLGDLLQPSIDIHFANFFRRNEPV